MNIIINYKQYQATRGLLYWNQKDLNQRAEVAKSTIGDFERGARNLRIKTMQKLVRVFEENGIRFASKRNRIFLEKNHNIIK